MFHYLNCVQKGSPQFWINKVSNLNKINTWISHLFFLYKLLKWENKLEGEILVSLSGPAQNYFIMIHFKLYLVLKAKVKKK